MKNFVLLNIIKISSIIFSFLGALSFLRSVNNTFDWHMQFVHPRQLNFSNITSLLIFLASMTILTCAIWQTKKPRWTPFYRRIDFFTIALAGLAIIYECYQMLRDVMLTPWELSQGMIGNITVETFVNINMSHFGQYFIGIPIVAFTAAIIAYMEIVARLRDKNLAVHWYMYFKAYPFWPSGISAVAMLGSLVYFVFSASSNYMKIAAVIALILSSYFAEFLLNMSQSYDKANADKIQAERFKSELITNVSHDIKTPLTSIINYVDLLKNEGLQGQPAEYLQVLERKSARLKVLIDDLMEASKAGTGNLKVEIQKINLGEIIGQVAGEFADSFADNGLTLVLRQPDEPIIFNIDSRHLYRILENLFSNAAKYTLKGTRVFVEIALCENKPHIIVQNTSAIPVSLSDGEITAQFIRGDKSRQTEGSGLGLYIAKSLVELMGGKLSINISGDLFRVDIHLMK